jgi:hypothetical protein
MVHVVRAADACPVHCATGPAIDRLHAAARRLDGGRSGTDRAARGRTLASLHRVLRGFRSD